MRGWIVAGLVVLAGLGSGHAASPMAVSVRQLEVVVPADLVVSEDNSFVPNADIVWHGDPAGDRAAQVAILFREALADARLTGAPANVQIELVQFHGITPRARYNTGGNYRIRFRLTLTDPRTGALLAQPRLVKADIRAWGGNRAVQMEAQGITEHAFVRANLAAILRREIHG